MLLLLKNKNTETWYSRNQKNNKINQKTLGGDLKDKSLHHHARRQRNSNI